MERCGKAVLVICGLLLALNVAWGQGAVGTLNGTVLDAAGAVVPGAVVTGLNQDTGGESKTTSTSSGSYTLPYLPAGTYTIKVAAPGFRTASAENVILRVAQTLTVNINLELGQLSEQVTVSATPPLLESGTAEIGRYISEAEYKSWPILVGDGQRQIQEFIFSSLPGTTGGTFKGSINGGQEYSHEILIEGIPVGRSDLSGGNNNEFSPSAEAVGEFKLQTGAMSAQYNGGQTAVANFSIKSGTNELHGTGFLYLQNEAFDALSLSNKTQGNPKSRHRDTNYGYSIGGPVYIPKIYDGRNKTFFFTNFEKDKVSDLRMGGFTTVAPVSWKQGDFARILDAGYTGDATSGSVLGTDALGRSVMAGQIFDPKSTRRLPSGEWVRDPFPNNMIPKSLWDPVAVNVIDQVGLTDPTFDRMVRNIEAIGTSSPYFDLHIVGIKGDHVISDRHRLTGYYNHSYRFRNNNGGNRYLPIPGPVTSSWQDQLTPGRMVRLALNSTLSPTIINRVAAGFNRFLNQNGAPLDTLNQDWAGQIGIQNTSDAWFPEMNFGGTEAQGGRIGKLGVGFWGAGSNGSWIVNDDVTKIHGKHTLHIGYEYRNYYYNDRVYSSPGTFSFRPDSTAAPGFLSDTGNSFASFLLGAVNNANRSVVGLSPGFKQPHHAFYVADDFKITPKLTMNMGLRWEIIPSFYERTGRMSFIDLDAPNPDAGGRKGALAFRNKPSDTYFREFGPRLGLAYQVNNTMVVRAGYAMTNTPPIRNDWGYGGFTYGYSRDVRLAAGTSSTGFEDDPVMYLSERYPDLVGPLPNTEPGSGNWSAYQTTAPDANRPGYVQNWNFTVQYQLPSSTVLEVAYVGNKGTRLWGSSSFFGEMNGLPASMLAMGDILTQPVSDHPEYTPYEGFDTSLSVSQALRPYPQYFSVQEAFPYNSNSTYNSLQITATRHLSQSLGFIAAYTWSKTLTSVDSNGPGAYYATIQDYYNRGLERSIASFNYPRAFKLTWVYRTPFGKGQRWDLGKMNFVLGGWELSAIHNYRSGNPIAIGQSGLTVPDGFSGTIRPDVLTSDYTLGGAPENVDFFNATPYLNPAAFQESPRTANGVPLRVGTAPRYVDGLRGPHDMSETFRMAKKFQLYKERVNFGVGMVMTNPFNRTGRSFVTTNISESDFGKLLQTGGGRTLQVEGRVEF